MQKRGLQWIFAPAKAPEWGGAYERVVGLFKKIFSGVVNGSQLTVETFHTFAISTEGILNSRPLVPVPTDRRDPEALSPLSFLCPGVLAVSSSDVLPPIPVNRLPLAKSWHFLRGMLDSFWKRWVREYLTLLQNRRKWATKQRNLRINDVVLLVDKQTPRDQWPLGIIVGVTEGEDNLVRRVTVKTAKSDALDRHVAHIVLLEATPDEETTEEELAFSGAVGGHKAASGGTNGVVPVTPERDIETSRLEFSGALTTPQSAKYSSLNDQPEEACLVKELDSSLEEKEDRRSRIGLPLRVARLAHPHGT